MGCPYSFPSLLFSSRLFMHNNNNNNNSSGWDGIHFCMSSIYLNKYEESEQNMNYVQVKVGDAYICMCIYRYMKCGV